MGEKKKVIYIDGKKFYATSGSGKVFIQEPVYAYYYFWKIELSPNYVGVGKTLKDAILDFHSGRIKETDVEAERVKKEFEKDVDMLILLQKKERNRGK